MIFKLNFSLTVWGNCLGAAYIQSATPA